MSQELEIKRNELLETINDLLEMIKDCKTYLNDGLEQTTEFFNHYQETKTQANETFKLIMAFINNSHMETLTEIETEIKNI